MQQTIVNSAGTASQASRSPGPRHPVPSMHRPYPATSSWHHCCCHRCSRQHPASRQGYWGGLWTKIKYSTMLRHFAAPHFPTCAHRALQHPAASATAGTNALQATESPHICHTDDQNSQQHRLHRKPSELLWHVPSAKPTPESGFRVTHRSNTKYAAGKPRAQPTEARGDLIYAHSKEISLLDRQVAGQVQGLRGCCCCCCWYCC